MYNVFNNIEFADIRDTIVELFILILAAWVGGGLVGIPVKQVAGWGFLLIAVLVLIYIITDKIIGWGSRINELEEKMDGVLEQIEIGDDKPFTLNYRLWMVEHGLYDDEYGSTYLEDQEKAESLENLHNPVKKYTRRYVIEVDEVEKRMDKPWWLS